MYNKIFKYLFYFLYMFPSRFVVFINRGHFLKYIPNDPTLHKMIFTDKKGKEELIELLVDIKNYVLYSYDEMKTRLFPIKENSIIIFDKSYLLHSYNSQRTKMVDNILEKSYRNNIPVVFILSKYPKEPIQFYIYGIALGLYDRSTFFPWLMKHGYSKKELPNNKRVFVFNGNKEIMDNLYNMFKKTINI